MTATAQGALVGCLLGTGLVLTLAGLPWLHRPGLHERLAPYVRDTASPSSLLRPPGASRGLLAARHSLSGLVAQAVRELGEWVEQVIGGASSVRRRQLRAGLSADVAGFRAEQVLWSGAALGVGGAVVTAIWWRSSAGGVPLAVLVLICGATGGAARDWYLSRQARRREQRMLAEFPAIAEMLALAVGAGEGAVGALDRVARASDGELSAELRRTLGDARAGASLVQALQGLSDRTGLLALARFVDGVVVAVERGTPLADVLRAQAQDVRVSAQRALMDAAGRKEIAMMVPVVFGVLPVTVVFAVYPGFAFLRLGV